MIELKIQTTSHDRAENGWTRASRWDEGYRNPPRVRTLYAIRVVV